MFWLDTSASWYLTVKNEGKEEVCPQPCLVLKKTKQKKTHNLKLHPHGGGEHEYVHIQLSLGEECVVDQSIYSVHLPHS